MEEYVDVSKDVYIKFISWGSKNIDGFHYEIATIADRTLFKDGNDEVLAYKNLAYEKTFHIKKKVLDMCGE